MATSELALEQARERALELIRQYDDDAGALDTDPASADQTANPDGAALQTKNMGSKEVKSELPKARTSDSFLGASPGFAVLDMRTEKMNRPDEEEDVYQDLKDFLENKPLRPASKVLREREKKARLEAIRNGDLPRPVPLPKPELKSKEQLIRERKNKSKAKDKRLRLDKAKRETNNNNEDDTAREGEQATSINKTEPQSPRSPPNSPPSILDPGHHVQVAWNGIPKDLQKLYFSPNAQAHRASQQKSSGRKVQLETEQEKKQRAVRFVQTSMLGAQAKGEPASGSEASKRLKHQQWLGRKALERRRQKNPPPNNQTNQASGTASVGDRAREMSTIMRSSSSCSRFAGYHQLCKLARTQVLEERKRQLQTMQKRRDAAELLQRALRCHFAKLERGRLLQKFLQEAMMIQNTNASRLQAIFRGHATRIIVTKLLKTQTAAAKKMQRMVRNSLVAKQNLMGKKLEIVSTFGGKGSRARVGTESNTSHEHQAWMQRVVRRTTKETEKQRHKSILSCTPDNVKDWIMGAPKIDDTEDDAAEEDAAEEEQKTNHKGGEGSHPAPPVPRLCLSSSPRHLGNTTTILALPRKPSAAGGHQTSARSSRRRLSTQNHKSSLFGEIKTQRPSLQAGGLQDLDKVTVNAEEFEAMNDSMQSELANKVDSVHGRVVRLQSTLSTIARREKRMPSLRFQQHQHNTNTKN